MHITTHTHSKYPIIWGQTNYHGLELHAMDARRQAVVSWNNAVFLSTNNFPFINEQQWMLVTDLEWPVGPSMWPFWLGCGKTTQKNGSRISFRPERVWTHRFCVFDLWKHNPGPSCRSSKCFFVNDRKNTSAVSHRGEHFCSNDLVLSRGEKMTKTTCKLAFPNEIVWKLPKLAMRPIYVHQNIRMTDPNVVATANVPLKSCGCYKYDI